MAQYNTLALQSEDTRVEVQTTIGNPWLYLYGAASVSVSGGDATSRTVRDLSDTEITITGKPGNPSVSIPINLYNPQIQVHRELKEAKDAGRNIMVRWTTAQKVIRSYTGTGNTVAISDTGVVTFAGTNTPDISADYFATGLVIRVGTTEYLVDSYNADGTSITVVDSNFADITTAVAATENYELRKPAVRRPGFIARIINMDVEDIGEQSQLSTTLDLQPETTLPDWELVVGTN